MSTSAIEWRYAGIVTVLTKLALRWRRRRGWPWYPHCTGSTAQGIGPRYEPASTQPIFIKSTHTESMIALVKTSISLDRHAAHPRIGRFSKAAGTVNCGHRVSEHSGMWSCMSFPSMRNFSLAHMTTRLPARKGVSNRSLYVISIRSVAVHPITNLPDQHSAENGVVASGALPRPTFSPHCTPHASSWQSSAPTYGNLDCAKPSGRLVVSTCSKPTVHPKFQDFILPRMWRT